jgi:hypothetical protein
MSPPSLGGAPPPGQALVSNPGDFPATREKFPRNFPRWHRFLPRNLEIMKRKITAFLGACAALALVQPVLADDTTPPTTPPSTPPAKPPGAERHNPAEYFKKLDTNNDGFLSKEEFMARAEKAPDPAKAKARLEERFTSLDTNKDGKISLEEFIAGAPKGGPGGPGHHHGDKPPGEKPPGEAPPAPPAPPAGQ